MLLWPHRHPEEDPQEAQELQLASQEHHWATELLGLARDLDRLAHETEVEFLHLGENLNVFFQGNRAAERQSAEMLERSGDQGRLSRALERIDHGAMETTKALDQLQEHLIDLGARIEEIEEFNWEMKNACRSLNMLGISLKIETSRVNAHEFLLVIDSLEELVGRIAGNVKEIEASAREAKTKVELANRKVHERNRIFQVQLATRHSSLIVLGRLLESGQDQDRKECHRIGTLARDMGAQIAQVVESLQFHDAGRQRIEHTAEAMVKAAHRLDQGAHRSDQDDQERAELFGWLRGVILVQIAQLEELRRESGQVAAQIGSNFQKMYALAQEQSTLAAGLSDRSTNHRERLASLGERFQNVGQLFETVSHQMEDLMSGTGETEGRLRHLIETVGSVNSNRMSLKMLAINSELQAFAAGERGITPGIISEQISGLSNLLQNMVEAKQQGIAELLSRSEDFGRLFNERLLAQMERLSGLREMTVEVVDELRSEAEDALVVSRATQDLEGLLHDAENNLGFDQQLQDGLGASTEGLQRLLSSLEEIARRFGIEVEVDGHARKHSDESYSMDREREIHAAALGTGSSEGGESQPEEASVELFEPEDSPMPAKAEQEKPKDSKKEEQPTKGDAKKDQDTGDTPDLGDNVELF